MHAYIGPMHAAQLYAYAYFDYAYTCRKHAYACRPKNPNPKIARTKNITET